MRASHARSRAAETDEDRQKRLAAERASNARSLSDETCEKRQKRLDAKNSAQARLRATETAEERRTRLGGIKINRVTRICCCYECVADRRSSRGSSG